MRLFSDKIQRFTWIGLILLIFLKGIVIDYWLPKPGGVSGPIGDYMWRQSLSMEQQYIIILTICLLVIISIVTLVLYGMSWWKFIKARKNFKGLLLSTALLLFVLFVA